MNIIYKILLISIVYIVISSIFKNIQNEYLFLIRLCTVCIIAMLILNEATQFLDKIESYLSVFELNTYHIGLLFKMVGISIITDFACDILKDNGENAISNIVSLSGKIIILTLAMPLLDALINICIKILD